MCYPLCCLLLLVNSPFSSLWRTSLSTRLCLGFFTLQLTLEQHRFELCCGSTYMKCVWLVTQPCLTLCNPIDYSLPGSLVHGDSPGKNTGVGCHALLQEIVPTQGSNPGLQHCRWILYCLSHQESPTQELNQGLLHCRWILYQLSYLPGKPTYMQILPHKHALHHYMDLWLAECKVILGYWTVRWSAHIICALFKEGSVVRINV